MFRHLFAWTVALCLLSISCSSSSDPTPSIFSGQLRIPAGPAAQTVGGLVPVAGATIELVRVDEFGAQVGEVLATATTDVDGDYTIELPAGVSFSADLVVRVSGGPAAGLRAQVVGEEANIDPASEYLLRELTTGGNTLADVTASEVAGLLELLDEFAIESGETIEDAISALDDAAAETIDPVIETAVQEQGDTSLIAGGYHFVQFGLEVDTSVASLHFADFGSFSLMAGNDGAGTFEDLATNEFELELMANPNGNGGASYQLFSDSDDVDDDITLPIQFPADGSLVVFVPAFEEIDPSVGSREPAVAHTLYPVGNAFIGALSEEERVYGLTPGGLLDTSNLIDRIVSHSIFVTAREEAIANSALDGSVFGYITIGELYEGNGTRELFADLGTQTFASSGATQGTATVSDEIISLFRTPITDSLDATVEWGAVGQGGVDDPIGEDDGTEPRSYVLDPASGKLTMTQQGDGEDFVGFVGNGGELLVMRETFKTGEAENSIGVGVKLGTANPAVTGSYRVLAIQKGYTGSGASMVNRYSNAELTIDGGAVSVELPDRVTTKSDDLASELSTVAETDTENGTVTFTGTNGRANMLIEGSKLSGFFSADGQMAVFRFADSDFAEGDEATVGMVILIRK